MSQAIDIDLDHLPRCLVRLVDVKQVPEMPDDPDRAHECDPRRLRRPHTRGGAAASEELGSPQEQGEPHSDQSTRTPACRPPSQPTQASFSAR